MTQPNTSPSSKPRDAAEALVSHALRTRYESLPSATVERTKLIMLDTMGAALAGRDADGCLALRKLVTAWGGTPEATLIGVGTRIPAHNAALVNATMARALELDEVHEQALVHSAATIVPVALAAAERWGQTSGKELIAAVAVGLDVCCRLALAPTLRLGGAGYVPRAISRTYTTGALAGALVAAKLAGAGEDTMRHALGIAYSQCGGNQQGLSEGVLMVRVQQGLCASQAILSQELADAGISGVSEPLEGKFGYYEAFWRGDYDRQAILAGLGERFEGDNVSIKPYACCKYAHTGIAAALELAGRDGFHLQDVEQVIVRVQSTDCWELLCDPLELKSNEAELAGRNGWSLAQFSFPYVIAAALARGRLSMAELSEGSRRDPQILSLLRKVKPVLEENSGSAHLPEPGDVEIRFTSGRSVRQVVKHAPGHPKRPMTEAEVLGKFLGCASRLSDGRARLLADSILALDDLPDARTLLKLSIPENTQ